MSKKEISLIGAGPVGCLLAVHLARKGIAVKVFERRPDMRRANIPAGRSINLALSIRGIYALQELGIDKEILARAIPMYGRSMHSPAGELSFQRYGIDDSQYINSISRGELNKALLNYAEKTSGIEIFFEQKLSSYNFATRMLSLVNEITGDTRNINAESVIGCDGSASVLRDAMKDQKALVSDEELLDYGYKELSILPDSDGKHKMMTNALHIWPRGSHMLIALPNFDGSFTCTLFLRWKGAQSFESLSTPAAVTKFFTDEFSDASKMIHDLQASFFTNPTGKMVTVRSAPWRFEGQALLMGDAAHAIVPFFGQGLNCGFEDCTILKRLLDETTDLNEVFGRFYNERKEDADAIATLALENFVEMRDKVAQPRFLLEKAIEKNLMREFPDSFISRYSAVTFSRAPYRLALKVGRLQDKILGELSRNISRAEEVNLAQAKKLIDQELGALMIEHSKEFFK